MKEYYVYVMFTDPLAKRLECSPKAWKTGVQSQVEAYQKLKKNVLDASMFNTQHYKVWIKSKMEQSRERSSVLTYTSV